MLGGRRVGWAKQTGSCGNIRPHSLWFYLDAVYEIAKSCVTKRGGGGQPWVAKLYSYSWPLTRLAQKMPLAGSRAIFNCPVAILGVSELTERSIQSIFRTLLWSTFFFSFSLLDGTSSSHYIDTNIIKFGWKLFVLWIISDGLSFSGFAQFPWFKITVDWSKVLTIKCSVFWGATHQWKLNGKARKWQSIWK